MSEGHSHMCGLLKQRENTHACQRVRAVGSPEPHAALIRITVWSNRLSGHTSQPVSMGQPMLSNPQRSVSDLLSHPAHQGQIQW